MLHLLVVLRRLALEEPDQIVVGKFSLVPVLFDRLAGDLAAVDKETAFRPFEQNTVRAAAIDDHLHAALELALDGKVVGRVVAIVHGGITVFQRHWMLGVGAVDFDRSHTRLILPGSPGGDVDVMGAPIGELTAGILVPPSERAVAPLLDIRHLGCLAEPHVPIEFRWRCGLLERAASLPAVDAYLPTVFFMMASSTAAKAGR